MFHGPPQLYPQDPILRTICLAYDIHKRGCYQIDVYPWEGSKLDWQWINSNGIKEHGCYHAGPARHLTSRWAKCNQDSTAPFRLHLGGLISFLPLTGARLWAPIRNPFPFTPGLENPSRPLPTCLLELVAFPTVLLGPFCPAPVNQYVRAPFWFTPGLGHPLAPYYGVGGPGLP